MMLFKATLAGRRPTHASNGFVWPAPSGKRPGKWTDAIKGIAACQRGYHLTEAAHLIDWLSDELWVAEGRGEHLDNGDKHVYGAARLIRRLPWDEKTARLFAADCAEHVLPIFERERPDDDRPRKAIEAARAYARGEINAAAWDAARAAAEDAAEDAAWAAARAAAEDAARAAAWAAAWAAAGAAAGAAAWAAAGDAARAAAGDAAWAAERDWQTRTLLTALGLS